VVVSIICTYISCRFKRGRWRFATTSTHYRTFLTKILDIDRTLARRISFPRISLHWKITSTHIMKPNHRLSLGKPIFISRSLTAASPFQIPPISPCRLVSHPQANNSTISSHRLISRPFPPPSEADSYSPILLVRTKLPRHPDSCSLSVPSRTPPNTRSTFGTMNHEIEFLHLSDLLFSGRTI
jgi:hypothetical protein